MNTHTDTKADFKWSSPDIELKPDSRIRLVRDVERFPHFIAKKGLTGQLVPTNPKDMAYARSMVAKMDKPLKGAEEWDNCIIWDIETDEDYEQFCEDIQLLS